MTPADARRLVAAWQTAIDAHTDALLTVRDRRDDIDRALANIYRATESYRAVTHLTGVAPMSVYDAVRRTITNDNGRTNQ